ncbi:hypothetical protein GFER_16450 [Geoalkalibacter ferrihydriticus DSM 17813]|uniref:Uncharacterized protein n=1 Tax=Geoalkalibacter ferrihydriticus DSM 17813 TaxID=1121915 RepID=A0A0C2HRY7_9BACT|nr:hypothetical protein GFER_16450 [Geoalkalibacter ferrihydriticus DSM 17813]
MTSSMVAGIGFSKCLPQGLSGGKLQWSVVLRRENLSELLIDGLIELLAQAFKFIQQIQPSSAPAGVS